MKQTTCLGMMLLMAASMAFTACSKKQPTDQVKSNGLPKAEAAQPVSGEVAYVDIDTLAQQYDYCKEGQKALEAKQNAYRNQLNQKGQSLQNAMVAFQKKMQSGGFSSQQEAVNEQQRLQHQQQQLEQFQQKIEQDMQAAAANYQQVLRDSINSYLKDYNKDGRFKMILSKSGDNILYSDKKLDITADVVAGLNKRYSKKK